MTFREKLSEIQIEIDKISQEYSHFLSEREKLGVKSNMYKVELQTMFELFQKLTQKYQDLIRYLSVNDLRLDDKFDHFEKHK